MDTIELKRVLLTDVERLQKISRDTFYHAFAADNTEENIQQYLERDFSIEQLTAELNDDNSEFYFALLGSDVVGYLKLNFGQSQTDVKDEKAIEIERIYVLPEFQRKGVGQVLYMKAIQIAEERKADYIWLGVWEENKKAINFYNKNGFVVFDKHIFRLGGDEQTDLMMKRQLNDDIH